MTEAAQPVTSRGEVDAATGLHLDDLLLFYRSPQTRTKWLRTTVTLPGVWFEGGYVQWDISGASLGCLQQLQSMGLGKNHLQVWPVQRGLPSPHGLSGTASFVVSPAQWLRVPKTSFPSCLASRASLWPLSPD